MKLQIEYLKLETSQLLLAGGILLLDRDEPFYQVVLGLLQVTLTNPLDITVWVNT